MSRIPPLAEGDMTDEQKRISAEVAGPRSGLTRGPFPVWLRSPELLDRVNRLAVYFKDERDLPGRLRELAILINARHWSSQYQWHVHIRHARRLGIADAVTQAIAEGRVPEFENEDERCVYRFCRELLGAGELSDEAYGEALRTLGEPAVIELVTLVGFYSLIAVAIKGFDAKVPDGEPLPLA